MKGQFTLSNLVIAKPTRKDIESAYDVFATTITDAFEKEDIGHLKEDISKEIQHKKKLMAYAVANPDSEVHFLVAKIDNRVIGTISFGPCGSDIKKCTNNELDAIGELGSLCVLPDFQGKGVGSALIHAMIKYLAELGVRYFCLDSGYQQAQRKWLRKFGEPYRIAKDYWGKGLDHMVWLCRVVDHVK
ncbi:MAG: GNAT family N-acetyltransferase [Firmicutes bacterium]|nr:GNAT family N-acetyltransferase [Bacillota bacterium]